MHNKLTGLFFGSFNPVHIGHLLIANYFVEFTEMCEVWFIVSPQSPFKQKQHMLPERQRLHLLNLAIESDDRFRASDIEFSMPKPSYTIDTLTYLSEKHPDRQFAIIMGSDNLTGFAKWKNYNEILRNYRIYVYPRKNTGTGVIHENIVLTEAPAVEISSSLIRDAIASNRDIRHYLPAPVWEYISAMNFFR